MNSNLSGLEHKTRVWLGLSDTKADNMFVSSTDAKNSKRDVVCAASSLEKESIAGALRGTLSAQVQVGIVDSDEVVPSERVFLDHEVTSEVVRSYLASTLNYITIASLTTRDALLSQYRQTGTAVQKSGYGKLRFLLQLQAAGYNPVVVALDLSVHELRVLLGQRAK